jgi:hypothetical protein
LLRWLEWTSTHQCTSWLFCPSFCPLHGLFFHLAPDPVSTNIVSVNFFLFLMTLNFVFLAIFFQPWCMYYPPFNYPTILVALLTYILALPTN